MTWNVEIRRHNDDGVEKVFGPYENEARAEKIDDGLNINLNHDVYYTVIAPAAPDEDTPRGGTHGGEG